MTELEAVHLLLEITKETREDVRDLKISNDKIGVSVAEQGKDINNIKEDIKEIKDKDREQDDKIIATTKASLEERTKRKYYLLGAAAIVTVLMSTSAFVLTFSKLLTLLGLG